VTGTRDWYAWHDQYADPLSSLGRRLRLVQQHVEACLDARSGTASTVVSMCAGQGHDVLGALAGRPDAGNVGAYLVENNERNVAAARAAASAAAIPNVTVLCADAGELAVYADIPPADLLLVVGVFGNISDADVHRTIDALPQLCAAGATVIWTRVRQPPDLTPTIRRWFATAGFAEQSFVAPADELFTVGVHRLVVPPKPPGPPARLFRFLR